MGNQSTTAETISKTVNNAITNVMLQNSSSCGQNNTSVQNISFSNIKTGPGCSLDFSGISQTSTQTPNFSCSSDSNQSSSLQTALSAALTQAVKSESSGISGALLSDTHVKSTSDIINNITNNVNVSNVSSCVQSNLSSQEQVYNTLTSSCPAFCNSGTIPTTQVEVDAYKLCTVNFNNINQTLTQAAVAKCTANNSALTNAINQAAVTVSQEASSESTGFLNITKIAGDITGVVGGVVNAYIICLVLILCSCILPSIISIIGMNTSSGKELSSSAAGQLKNYDFAKLGNIAITPL